MGMGERIKQAREDMDLTMAELARLIGVNRSAICRWESDDRTPRAIYLCKLANVLGVSVDYLVGTARDSKAG